MSTTRPQLGQPEFRDADLQRELERRLGLRGSSDYDDPARRDLPRVNIAALLLVVIAVVSVFFLALY